MCVQGDCQSLYKQASGRVTVFTNLWASQIWIPFSLSAILLAPSFFCISLILLGNMIWYCGLSGIANPVLVIWKSRILGVCFIVWVLV